MESEGGIKPQIHGGSLFLVDLAMQFSYCNQLRGNRQLQRLLEKLEGISLMFVGYYEPGQYERIRSDIIALRKALDIIIKDFEKTGHFKVSEKIRVDFYDLETKLRGVWKSSGLQMGFESTDELNDFWNQTK